MVSFNKSLKPTNTLKALNRKKWQYLPNSSFMSTMFKADLEGKTSKYGCKHSHKIYHGQLFFWSDDSVKGKETLKIYTYRDSEVNKQKPTTIIKQPTNQPPNQKNL